MMYGQQFFRGIQRLVWVLAAATLLALIVVQATKAVQTWRDDRQALCENVHSKKLKNLCDRIEAG